MKTNKTAIIIHGGAIKGAFGAGVLYNLSKIGIKRTDMIIGTGSSVPTSAYFVSKQFGSLKNIWVNEIGTKKLISYKNLIIGKPIFNLPYLIKVIFKQKYPLDIEKIFESKSLFMIPLYNYRRGKLEFFNNREERTKKDFWKILQASMTIHNEHIVRKEVLEQFVDADLDPFALYRQEIIPKEWNVLVVINHKNLVNTIARWIGVRFFRLTQSRHFPEEVREKLKIRDELRKSGLELFNKFKAEYQPIIISPTPSSKLNGGTQIARDIKQLSYLFSTGEQAVMDMMNKKDAKQEIEIFIKRSKELAG